MTVNAPQIAQGRTQAANTRWRWYVRVGNKVIRRATTATVSYSEEGAASVELQTDVDLRRMERAEVEVHCGYGNSLVKYFVGKLDDPIRDPFTGETHATAYGVQGAMGRQYFDRPADYSGWTLPQFFMDVNNRLYDQRAVITVNRAFDVVLEEKRFGGEASLGEAAASVMENVEMVMLDRPDYDLLVIPKPRPVIGAQNAIATYSPRHYPPGALTIQPATEGPFSKVVVHRYDDDGNEVIRAERRIVNPGPYFPKPNEILFISDFPGTQAGADRLAATTALAAATGSFGGSLSGVPANPAFLPPRPVNFVQNEDENGRKYSARYASRLSSVTIDLVSGLMDTTFAALLERRIEVEDRVKPPRVRRSPHVMFSARRVIGRDLRGLPYFDTQAMETAGGAWFGYDEHGNFWFDPDLAPGGAAGYDETMGRPYVDFDQGGI